VKTAIWHASSRLWSTIPLSNAFANGASKSRSDPEGQDGEAVADNAPVNTDGGNVADNAATEKRKPSAATLKASKTAATGKPTLSTAMQALAVITGALASGTAAGIITYLMFPDGGPNKR